jgi:hypothetical protein
MIVYMENVEFRVKGEEFNHMTMSKMSSPLFYGSIITFILIVA